MASLAASSECTPTSWQAYSGTGCSPHMLQDHTHRSSAQEHHSGMPNWLLPRCRLPRHHEVVREAGHGTHQSQHARHNEPIPIYLPFQQIYGSFHLHCYPHGPITPM
jgi:hypothetical protein